MTSLAEIRQAFLHYFKNHDHHIVSSSRLVPENDPSLLFTNAGMVQFKDYFTGKVKAPFKRAATAQKCVRAGGKHNDLENVGYTGRHHTFFEMLGNFSFGDYFKEQAIDYAWDVVTKEFALSPERIYITVFAEDDEAALLWKKISGFSDTKIIRISSSDNFWSMGDTGPCGPCSEIFYDKGEQVQGGLPGTPDSDGDRYTEIWNLVFMQYRQEADGQRYPLPKPCIDTGIGLERLASVLQGTLSNYDIDLFHFLLDDIRGRAGVSLGVTHSLQVVADHIRSICFLIADGVMPLNEGRGYVLRRIIRRAVRHSRLLGMEEPFLWQIVPKLVELMSEAYPDLKSQQRLIQSVLLDEETRFRETLEMGMQLVENSLSSLQGKVLPGQVAFRLYDTYGFPLDLTEDILREKGLSVDRAGFEAALQKQKEISKQSKVLGTKVKENLVLEELSPIRNLQETQKKCYETELLSLQTVLFAERIKGSNSWRIVLDGTPFFAESGGQVGDTGFLKNEHGVFRVDKTSLLTFEGKVWISHEGEFLQGHFQTGQGITAEVNEERRRKIASHHSATHLLQAALRQRLGSHVTQKGSLVEEHHLRFDFSHPKELSEEEKTDIENIVNAVIFSASPVELLECSQEEAHCLGALSFFGEKYGEKVRVVRMKKCKDYFSQELCGGTHVRNTGQIGGVKILSESGIAAGVRRIEAVAGPAFLEWVREVLKEKDETIVRLKCEQKKMARQLQKVESANAQKSAEITKEKCGEWWLIHQHLGELPAQQARECAQQQGASLSSGVLLITSLQEGHISLIVEVGAQDVDKISAHDLIQVACLPLQGQGGGKRHRAQGGSAHPEYFGKALDAVRAFLKECPN